MTTLGIGPFTATVGAGFTALDELPDGFVALDELPDGLTAPVDTDDEEEEDANEEIEADDANEDGGSGSGGGCTTTCTTGDAALFVRCCSVTFPLIGLDPPFRPILRSARLANLLVRFGVVLLCVCCLPLFGPVVYTSPC